MDVRRASKNIDDGLPVKQFVDQFAQHAYNENDKLPIELMNVTGTYLQHLNDDCLLEIFSAKSLSLTDLCSLAETCRRFQQISQCILPKDLIITIRRDKQYAITSRKYLRRVIRSSEEIERIFKNFGSGLTEVSISSNSYNHRKKSTNFLLTNLVADYCVDTLKRLRIEGVNIPAVLAVKLKPVFKQLQILELKDVSIPDDQTLFADLDSLIELSVCWVKNDSAILKNIFPKLERFTNGGYQFRIDLIYHPLLTFISRHRNLKELEVQTYIDDVLKVNFLQVIGTSCKELEELELNMGDTNASSLLPLQELQSLKILKLWHAKCDDLKIFAALTKLRELHLNWCDLPTDSNQFTFSEQLTKLVIIGGWFSPATFDVVGIIRRLINLEVLNLEKLDRRFVMDEEIFSKILNVVRGRPNVLTLKCKFKFVLKTSDENQKVKLISY